MIRKRLMLVMMCFIAVSLLNASSWEKVKTAKEINIKEAFVSFGKHYAIYVDGEEVGTVSGELFTGFGDTFTIRDNEGNIMLSESQQKRTFRFSLDRLAVINSPDGKVHGFMGEEVLNDFFNPFVKWHFYDENEIELGYTKFKLSIILKKSDYLNVAGSLAYKMNTNFNILVDDFTLTVYDSTNIPVEYAIFMACIQDAISDANEN